MNNGTSRINNQPLSEQANNYVKETQAEIQDMLHGGGQGDASTVGGGGTLTKADKRDLRRKKEFKAESLVESVLRLQASTVVR